MADPIGQDGELREFGDGTVLVEPMEQLTIDWISDNPGKWAFHCHTLYHMVAGMMRIVQVG